MTKKELLDGFKKYLTKNTNYKPTYIRDLKFAVDNVPFDFLERILLNWTVRDKPVLADSCNGTIFVECSEQTKRVNSYYHYWKHHKYYPMNHMGLTIINSYPVVDDYIQIVLDFVNNGELYYAITIVDIMCEIVERALIHDKTPITNKSKRYLSLNKTALPLFREYLELDKRFVQNVINTSATSGLYAGITKELIHKIDGAKALAKEIGVDKFIQYAIDQCYFFEPEIAVDRMNDIVTLYGNWCYLYARKSTMTTASGGDYGQDDDRLTQTTFNGNVSKENILRNKLGFKPLVVTNKTVHRVFTDKSTTSGVTNYPIIIDTDGNEELRSVINVDYTGYTVGAGKDNIFQNYRISHIWGHAYDPRYFTNLWNVVLVPAWANDLLDKPNPVEGSLESRLKSTIQRICELLYFNRITNWSALNIPQPSVCNEGNDIVMPNPPKENNKEESEALEQKEMFRDKKTTAKVPYLINIIKKKGSKKVGDIVKYAVYI